MELSKAETYASHRFKGCKQSITEDCGKMSTRCWKQRAINHPEREMPQKIVFDDYDEYDFRAMQWDCNYNPVLPRRNSSTLPCSPSSSSLRSSRCGLSIPCPSSPRSIANSGEVMPFTDLEFRSHFLPNNDSDSSSVVYFDEDDHYFSLCENDDKNFHPTTRNILGSSNLSTMCDTDQEFRSHFLPNNDSDNSSVVYFDDEDHYFSLCENDDKIFNPTTRKNQGLSDHSTMCDTCSTHSSTLSPEEYYTSEKFQDDADDDDKCFLPPLIGHILDAINGICKPARDSSSVMTLRPPDIYASSAVEKGIMVIE